MKPGPSLFRSPDESGDSTNHYLSASRLNAWLDCPLKFKFKHLDGIAMPWTAGGFVGLMVQDALAHFYRRRQSGERPDSVDLAQYVRERWKRESIARGVRFTDTAEEQTAQQRTLGVLAAYRDHMLPDEPRPLEVKRNLQAPLIDPESGEDLGLSLVDTLDLLLPEANGPLVVEFKVAARNSPTLETAVEIRLACLAYLVRNAFGLPESGFEVCQLVKTKAPQIIWHRYAPREPIHFQRLISVIRSYRADLTAKRYVFRPSLSCSYCDYRDGACADWAG